VFHVGGLRRHEVHIPLAQTWAALASGWRHQSRKKRWQRTGRGQRAGNLADTVVDSALRYRTQAPFVDTLLNEIGLLAH